MIAIVDYGSGNVRAIANVYRRLNVPCTVASTPAELRAADRIILPGVGAFDQVMSALNSSGLRAPLERAVLEDGKPLLGICVGMQLLADRSEEGGAEGLGWIRGIVHRMDVDSSQRLPVPHMGWNAIEPLRQSELFEGVNLQMGYYFLHSYVFGSQAPDTLAVARYGREICAAVNKGAIYGVQFHPEKSHTPGIRLLQNFATIKRL